MATTAASPLTLNLSLSLYHKPHTLLTSPLTSFSIRKPLSSHSFLKFHLHASPSPPNPSDYDDREEIRWLREEQRWLREEQRWLRQESHWLSERESLLREVSELKLKIQALERQKSMQGASISETIANVAAMLQVLKDAELNSTVGQITESGSSASPMLLEAKEIVQEEEKKEVVVKEARNFEREKGVVKKVKRKALRKGSEGEEVRVMQEALQRLGFYSGEEDMEYFCFSTGTERAVKTWQASLGASEDGVMTEDLLQRLYMEQPVEGATKGDNGAAVASVTKMSEIHQTVFKETDVSKYDETHHRVFLLGENRWEEPSRLTDRNNHMGRAKNSDGTTKCLVCRGDGRLLCMECDGTGEPNIEEQFIDWVDEGAKCPYCEGLGYTTCDVCQPKLMT